MFCDNACGAAYMWFRTCVGLLCKREWRESRQCTVRAQQLSAQKDYKVI